MTAPQWNIRALAYLGLDATNPQAWRTYATQILGLAESANSRGGAARFKSDARQWRIAVSPSARDGLAFLGFEVSGPADFAAAVSDIRAAGVAVEVDKDALAAERGVAAVAQFQDPDGNRLEIFWGPKEDFGPFQSPVGTSFGAAPGFGHVLLRTPAVAPMTDFYETVLGFRVSDLITMPGGKSARFLRCNARHHSIALVDLLPGAGIEHMMLEVDSLDDLGMALDRALESGVEITNSIGRHTNDLMVSFYMRTPGGFQIEYGWGGRLVDEATWSANEFQGRGDLWGHRGTMMDQMAEARADQQKVARS